MKQLPFTVVLLGLLAWGVVLAAPVDSEIDVLLTEVDEDVNRWNSFPRDASDIERRDLKLAMGRRLDRFSSLFGTGFGPIGTAPALGGRHRSTIDRAIRTLDRAALVEPDDYEVASSVAAAYIAIAHVQGHPSHPNLGFTQESAATYAKATRILGRVQRQAPDYGRGRSLISQARTSVYAYSRYPWFRPEAFLLLNLGRKEPGVPLRSEPNSYGGQVAATPRAGPLGQLVEEIVQAEGQQILSAFGDQTASSEGVDLQNVRIRYATLQRKAEEIWAAAEELHDSLAAEGGLRSEAIRYLARLQIFLEEATAALEASDAGRAKTNLVRAEYEIDRLGKIVGVRP